MLSKNQKATLFVVGSRVISRPEILQRAFKEGHQIAIHTWSHSVMTSLTNDQIVAELKWTEKAIFDAIGVTPLYWRPPYGDVDNRVRAIATQLGYKTAIWTQDFDTDDVSLPFLFRSCGGRFFLVRNSNNSPTPPFLSRWKISGTFLVAPLPSLLSKPSSPGS